MRGMMRRIRLIALFLAAAMVMAAFCGCDAAQDSVNITVPEATPTPEPDITKEPEAEPEDDGTEGLGDTFSGTVEEPKEEEAEPEPEEDDNGGLSKDVDLIFFMGQSNMSGAAGDASAAPAVSEEAGVEFRAVSDPNGLYPITEPFGINENVPTGLYEYPGAKKGSLVSAFVNEYHKLTGRRVVAVSISMGATDMDKWMTEGARADVKNRFDTSVSYLRNNGYNIGHIYALWLHGESDAIKGTDPEVYRTDLDNIMRPLFIGGLQKVFIIMPGRTIDYKDIFTKIVNVQKQICAESGYYAVATTVLTKISTEYMRDQYHYDQHVLNLVGIESADAVAYYTQHGVEKIVYDYREGDYIVPDGVEPDSQGQLTHLDLSSINIDEEY